MRTTLTEDEVAAYRRDGFLLMPDLLDAGELAGWREAVDAAAAERAARADALTNAGGDAYYQQVFAQLSGLRRIDARVAELLEDPRIGALAARLAGVDAIRLWNDQALFKPPFGNPTAWHLDAPYWSFEDRRAITIWVALDDATVENGCLWYLPGTHAEARFDAVELGSNLGGLFAHYPEWRARASVPAVLPAGGAVWHNGLVAHGAGANMTPRGRRAMTCAYMPDGVVYNGRRDSFVHTEAEAAALRPGDPLDDAAVNPLVWPRG
jgi:ectoine hydroxylase-related dioxygenase (phytanoyl-CoA dioxygenase family)